MIDDYFTISKWFLRQSYTWDCQKLQSAIHNQCKDLIPSKSLSGNVVESKIKNNKRRSRVEKPIWYKGEGLLTFNDKLVLKTQVRGKVTIIQNILQAFQALNWPEKIVDPFAKTIKSDRRFILGYLNKLAKKSGISFSRSPDRKFIQWHSPIQRDWKQNKFVGLSMSNWRLTFHFSFARLLHGSCTAITFIYRWPNL